MLLGAAAASQTTAEDTGISLHGAGRSPCKPGAATSGVPAGLGSPGKALRSCMPESAAPASWLLPAVGSDLGRKSGGAPRALNRSRRQEDSWAQGRVPRKGLKAGPGLPDPQTRVGTCGAFCGPPMTTRGPVGRHFLPSEVPRNPWAQPEQDRGWRDNKTTSCGEELLPLLRTGKTTG